MNKKLKTGCPFCDNNNKMESYKILDMEYGSIYLNYNQSFLGRCLYIPFDHYDLFSDIHIDKYLDYSKEIFIISDIIQKTMNAKLINIAMMCNQVSHVHWHIIPRYDGDSNTKNPPWPNNAVQLSKTEINKLKKRILKSFLNK